jgi:hypothetical protein
MIKQIAYDLNWEQVISVILSGYGVEDGFWQVGVVMETTSAYFPSQDGKHLPGHLVKIQGFRLTKVDGFGPMTVYKEGSTLLFGPKQGELTDGSDTDNSGLAQSSQGARKNRRPA